MRDARAKEMRIPPAAHEDPQSFEVARVWVAQGGQHVSLATGVWEDPMAWGILLVDLARHVARAYAQTEGRDERQVLEDIRAGIDAEWSSPSSGTSGHVLDS